MWSFVFLISCGTVSSSFVPSWRVCRNVPQHWWLCIRGVYLYYETSHTLLPDNYRHYIAIIVESSSCIIKQSRSATPDFILFFSSYLMSFPSQHSSCHHSTFSGLSFRLIFFLPPPSFFTQSCLSLPPTPVQGTRKNLHL